MMNSKQRLRIDDLKQVERLANKLVKLWIDLQKKHQLLQEDYDKFECRLQSNEQKYATMLSEKEADSKEKLSNAQTLHASELKNTVEEWQEKYSSKISSLEDEIVALKNNHAMEMERLITDYESKIDAQGVDYQQQIKKINQQLETEQMINKEMIARIRGVE